MLQIDRHVVRHAADAVLRRTVQREALERIAHAAHGDAHALADVDLQRWLRFEDQPYLPVALDKLMQNIIDTDKVWNKRISTAKLNRWLDAVTTQHPPPAVSGRRLKLKYMTQVKARPPAFMISCTRPDSLPESYVRYLTNGLRADFDMPGVPIRIHLKASENPFENRRKKR